MSALVNSLTQTQQALIRETDRAALVELSEDELLDLHTRVRRARNKYVGMYRRQASARIGSVGARGQARPTNRRNFDRAEVFEDALARVSRRLAVAAGQSAAELKAERIEAARREPFEMPAPTRARNARPPATPVRDRSPNSAGLTKQRASSQAQGARRQAKRDNR